MYNTGPIEAISLHGDGHVYLRLDSQGLSAWLGDIVHLVLCLNQDALL